MVNYNKVSGESGVRILSLRLDMLNKQEITAV